MADHEKSAKWDILTLFLEAELLEKALVSHHELDHLKKHIPSLMEENIQLKIPLVITIGTGQHWLEAH